MKRRLLALGCLLATTGLWACGEETGQDEDYFTSNQATLLTFEFDGELTTTDSWNVEQSIQDQLLYTIGHLNGDNSVGRLDTVVLSNIATDRLDDGTTHVKYHAVMPVGWGSKTNLPTSYAFTLPKLVDTAGQQAFTDKYKATCVEHGAHDVDASSMWYYYRPNLSGCAPAAADVVKFTATVTVSSENTVDKYPEYHKIWEDPELRVVAIFGKYEDGATTMSDSGISAYSQFVQAVRRTWASPTVTPANTPTSPGASNPDVQIDVSLGNGRKLVVNALLVDNVASAPQTFYDRYEGLSTEADIIFYNGHAGLGQNVRALSRRGQFRAGKYQIFYMNGCDSFAYVDGFLAKDRSTLNPDDPTGTKYMDMVTNVMPAFFAEMPDTSMALVRRLANPDDPKTYQQIFAEIDRSQVVVVTGEEDNVYQPEGNVTAWTFADGGTVATDESKPYALGTLPAGKYVIQLLEDQAQPGGDADLYVGLGKVPSLTSYDFRPYLAGSNEEVRFELTGPTAVNLLVNGYEAAAYKLAGRTE
jgi:hypothetical protein